MPTKLNIPAHTERLCEPCEHHKCVGSLHVRIGPGGYRDYNCMHPEAFDDLDEKRTVLDPEKEKLRQRLIGSMLQSGRHIGKTEKQPEWCPLRRTT